MNPTQDLLLARADALLSQDEFDFRAATILLSEIIRDEASWNIAQEARDALPLVQAAAARNAGPISHTVGRQRFEAVRQLLKDRYNRPFGRRNSVDGRPSEPIDQNRIVLGLPAWGQLSGQEIREAFRRVAKSAHPDAGGSASNFLNVTRARDVLLAQADAEYQQTL